MSRLVAFYELLEEDSRVLVELPVVGLSDVLDGTPRRITVLNPETGEIHPFGEEIPWIRGEVLTPGFVRPAPIHVPASPGWLAEIWTIGQDETYIGTFPVLAWEPGDQSDPDWPPGGEAVVLITEETEHARPGPLSTRLLPGMARYRRLDEPPFGPLVPSDSRESEQ